MTVASQVKQSLASLKNIHSSLQNLALVSHHDDAKRIFHETMLETETIIGDVKARIGVLEREEPQYNGF